MTLGNVVPTITIYTKGQLVRFGTGATTPFTFNGSPIDPTTVVMKIIDPAGVETTLTYGVNNALVRDDVGVYHTDVALTQSGRWQYRIESSGNLQAAAEAFVFVEPSDF